eukprot:COSAG01_NODE_18479_length_1073_cov_1.290554_1_plen_89_part_00
MQFLALALALTALVAPAFAAFHAEMPYVNGWVRSADTVRDDKRVTLTFVVKEQNAEEVRRIATAGENVFPALFSVRSLARPPSGLIPC